MDTLILYTNSPSFFSEIKAKKSLLDSVLESDLLIERKEGKKEGFALEREGEGVFHEIQKPLRLGKMIDALHVSLLDDQHKPLFLRGMKEIDLGQYILLSREMILKKTGSDQEIIVTEKERDMLMCLYNSLSHTIKKETLLEDVWGYKKGIETHTLETHIYRLRQKVEVDPSNPTWIVTTEEGYKLNCV